MRIGYSEDEEFGGQFELWQANCRRSLVGKQGQAALRELEAALLALPDKRLIANRLVDGDGDVCALGALGRQRGQLPTPDAITEGDWEDEGDDDMEEYGVLLGIPRLVAWKIVEINDIQIDGHYVDAIGPVKPHGWRPRVFIPVTPEERYDQVLAWVHRHLAQPATERKKE